MKCSICSRTDYINCTHEKENNMPTNLTRVMDRYGESDKKLLKAFPVLQYFEYDHLPVELAGVSQTFYETAWLCARMLEGSPEKSVALRKLLEAKDAAVRAAL